MYKILLTNPSFANDPNYSTELSRTIYNDAAFASDRTIITGTGKDSITEIPTFEFTILPNHPLYDQIHKFTSLITVYRGTSIKFYGRVINDGKDFYGQKIVSCEGALSFLIDTYAVPFSEKSITPAALLADFVADHNNLIDKSGMSNPEPYKRFTVGNITIDSKNTSKKFKLDSYQDTRSAIDGTLIKECKGYLFARYENGTLYLDWLKEFTKTNSQPVKMAVNLLDRTLEENADEYYTVMLPVGENKKTIESVNSGSKHLEDSTGIAKYGRIYKPESFSDKKTPAAIKEEAQKEFAKRGTNLPISANIKAVDMNLLGAEVDALTIGDKLTDVDSGLESLNQTFTIAENDYDILNPANDSFIVENQEAIDKRNNSTAGNGTISGRSGCIDRGLDEDKRDLVKTYDNVMLQVRDTYTLTANEINELSNRHNIYTKSFYLEADTIDQNTTETDIKEVSVPTFKTDRDYTPGYYVRKGGHTYRFLSYHPAGAWNEDGEGTEWVQDDTVSDKIYVKSIVGTTVHQNVDGQVINYAQDISGIRLNKVVEPLNNFDPTKAYAKDDEVIYAENGKAYKFLVDHPANTPWNFEQVVEISGSSRWHYETVYKLDNHGNYIIDLVTGEKVYDTQDDPDIYNNPPVRNVVNRTKDTLIDVIGNTNTEQYYADIFNDDTHYRVGDYAKYPDSNGSNYRFIADHPAGPWDINHVTPASDSVTIDGNTIYTITSISGSTIFRNEKELNEIVGETEIIQETDMSTSPPTVKKYFNIKNGSGISFTRDNTRVGLFENGQLSAGLMVESLNARSSDMPGNAFSSTHQYEVGDYCSRNGKVYQCTTRHKGAWSDADFTEASGKIVKLKADVIDLGEYATVDTLNANIIKVNNLTGNNIVANTAVRTDFLYTNTATVNSSLTVTGAVTLDSLTFRDESGPGDRVWTKPVSLYGDGTYVADIAALTIGTASLLNLRHYHDIDIEEVTTGANAGKMQVTLGEAVATSDTTDHIAFFKIADTAKYKADVGLSTVTEAGWAYFDTQDRQGYYDKITSTPKVGIANELYVSMPVCTINFNTPSATPPAYASVNAYGPNGLATVAAGKSLYLKADNDYCYIVNENANPIAYGQTGANVIARIANPKPSGSDGTISSVTLRPNLNPTYDSTEKEYTVYLRTTGTHITNSPYDSQVVISGSAAYNAGLADGSANAGLAANGAAISSGHSSYDMDDTGISPLLDRTGTALEANKYYRVLVTAKNGERGGVKFKTAKNTQTPTRVIGSTAYVASSSYSNIYVKIQYTYNGNTYYKSMSLQYAPNYNQLPSE